MIQDTSLEALKQRLTAITAADGQAQLTEFVHNTFKLKASIAQQRWYGDAHGMILTDT